MRYFVASTAIVSSALALPSLQTRQSSGCFPYGDAQLSQDYSKPGVSRDQWWCPADQAYGFQGFSYPLEDSDCSAESNGFDRMSADFAQMKRDFGASIVRVYYPACTQASVFENMLKAGVANNMAVIPQIWFGFDGDNSVWQASQQALYSVMDSEQYGAIAPYVFHSADFGSEPVGDGVDGGNFISDLAAFRQKMGAYGVPVAISEDWDRPGTMSGQDGRGLGETGQQVHDNSDQVHAHVMPYYHDDLREGQAWDYISGQIDYLGSTLADKAPLFVTESQWAWGPNEHGGGAGDVGVDQYTDYWKKFDDNCETFREKKVGWFIHTWAGEGTFDMKRDDGSYLIPNWKPRKC